MARRLRNRLVAERKIPDFNRRRGGFGVARIIKNVVKQIIKFKRTINKGQDIPKNLVRWDIEKES